MEFMDGGRGKPKIAFWRRLGRPISSVFTFTLDCHLGKTHNHRPRGDPAWGAQSAAHTHTETHTRATLRHKHRIEQKEEGGRECQGGEGGGQGGQLTFTDLARANV